MECEYASRVRGVKFIAFSTIAVCCLSTRHDRGMSDFGGIWPTVLSGAIEAGRSALRDLENSDIPAPLRRVAAYQGGRLPPPLATRMLSEIDKNEWFRDKVTEAWDGAAGEASDLFLNRPAGWWVELKDVGHTAGTGKEQRRLEDLQARLQQVEAKRETAVKKAAEYKKAVNDAGRRSKEMVEAARRTVEERFSSEVADLDRLRAELLETKELLSGLAAEHCELENAFDAVRSRLVKARRCRFDDSDHQAGSRSLPRDPVQLARLLDLQSAAMGRDAGGAPEANEVEPVPLHMAAGIRPDSSDAIRWLLGLEEAVVVVVDGYNAQFHIDRSDFTSGGARRRLVEALQRLRSAATVKHRIVVVYDSTMPGERVARTSLGGVEVRFAEKGRIADEEIVDLTMALDQVVVVSSDRAVRDGAEANGAVVLWSEALEQWLKRQ